MDIMEEIFVFWWTISKSTQFFSMCCTVNKVNK